MPRDVGNEGWWWQVVTISERDKEVAEALGWD